MTRDNDRQMRVIILYDSRTSGGSTDKLIDMIGEQLAEAGAYVEKAKCKATADYSFVRDFDVIIMGAPVYYLVVSSQLIGALVQSNLKKCLKNKNVALFVACGSPEALALGLYLPQLKIHLIRNKILSEKIFAPHQMTDPDSVGDFVEEIEEGYKKTLRPRFGGDLEWSDEAAEMLNQMPSMFSNKIRSALTTYAKQNGIKVITLEVLDQARSSPMGF